jgi:hypothetical protein
MVDDERNERDDDAESDQPAVAPAAGDLGRLRGRRLGRVRLAVERLLFEGVRSHEGSSCL